jgi:hypothetical protein
MPEIQVPIKLPPGNIDELMSLMQIGEGIVIIVDDSKDDKKEPCKRIYLHAFSGARDTASVLQFKTAMAAHKTAGTNGPSGDECLLYTGHVGISLESKTPIYGFNPDTGDLPGWLVIERLKEKAGSYEPYPGIVTDDTSVFNKAKALKLKYKILEYVYPESEFNEIKAAFNKSRIKTGLTYSFPGQGGDCNCATWPQEIGLSLPHSNGQMREYIASFENNEKRIMGDCCEQ